MFQDSLTKKIAEAASQIKTEPEKVDVNEKSVEGAVEKIMREALIGNQHKIDANKNNKIDAHDFKLLRAKKKMKEETELTESHFKVGDEVVCKASGMEGEVVKVDPKGEGKYYTVKREDGKTMKYAPNELKKDDEDEDEKEDEKEDKKVNEATAKQENKFHKKLDKLVHGTFGKSSDEKMKKEEVEELDELSKDTLKSYAGKVIDKTRTMPQGAKKQKHLTGLGKAMDKMKEEVELDEALWPGTPEYEKKFPKESKPGQRRQTQDYGYQGKEEEHGETTFKKEVKPRKSKYGARQNYVRSRKISGKTLKDDVELGFSDILKAYNTYGLKLISEMMKEEPDNEHFTKEVEEQKKRDKGEIRNDKGVAKPLQTASVREEPVNPVREESEQVEEGVLGSIAAGVGSFIGNKIDPTHGEMLRTHGPEVVRQLRYHATNAVNKVKNKIKKEEVEEIEERTLTEPETKKKEEIVKSMKKKMPGFKERYGERAKQVVYATATKIAKEKA